MLTADVHDLTQTELSLLSPVIILPKVVPMPVLCAPNALHAMHTSFQWIFPYIFDEIDVKYKHTMYVEIA